MSEPKSNSLENCTFIKTVLMLCVMIGHSVAFWSGTWFTCNPVMQANGLSYFYSCIGSFHTYAFTLVSGYLFSYIVLGGGYNNFNRYIKGKINRLIVPYWFVMVIWVAPISIYYLKLDWLSAIKKYILCINPSQLWFLWMLFLVFLLAWPIRFKILNNTIVGWGIAGALYVLGTIGYGRIPNVFCIWTALQYFVFFYVGVRIRFKEEKGINIHINIVPCYLWIIVDALLCVMDIVLKNYNITIHPIIITTIEFLCHLVGAVMAWRVLNWMASVLNWRTKGFLHLSQYSMTMYLFHQQFIYFSISLLNGLINPYINVGINFIVAFIGSFVISVILMQWDCTRFLVGEKKRSGELVL